MASKLLCNGKVDESLEIEMHEMRLKYLLKSRLEQFHAR
jgi:hypothetical protein